MDYALNRDRMRLKELSPIASFLLLVVVPIFALAAPREKAMAPSVRPLAVVAETKAEMARYSLKAYENRDQTNAVKGLHHLPSSRREVIAAFVPTALLLLAILGWHAGNPSTDGLLISECCRRLLTDR